MRSWDLFDTLVTSRKPGTPAGNEPDDRLIPIAENIAKVQPGDLVISDFDDQSKALRVLRSICGLPNKLTVTPAGKATGEVWKTLHPGHHTGDNAQSDVSIPRRFGITTELTELHKVTGFETSLGAVGLAMREARLTTWDADPTMRGLQLHQIERNFPFLLKVAHALDAKMRAEGFTRLLLCSRDAYLLCELMLRLFPNVDIRYFSIPG